jgi:hypothetical protein
MRLGAALVWVDACTFFTAGPDGASKRLNRVSVIRWTHLSNSSPTELEFQYVNYVVKTLTGTCSVARRKESHGHKSKLNSLFVSSSDASSVGYQTPKTFLLTAHTSPRRRAETLAFHVGVTLGCYITLRYLDWYNSHKPTPNPPSGIRQQFRYGTIAVHSDER